MDECWLDISGTEAIRGPARQVADELCQVIKFELGLTISVGVSFNKVFAKLGSDIKKPDAVTEIVQESFQDVIWNLPASDLLGVGRATKKVLDSYFIKTIGDLAKTEPDFLKRRFGKNGITLWRFANGLDNSPVMKQDFVVPIKSVGHGITTIADLESNSDVWPVVLELSQDIGHWLKKYQKVADGVAIHIRDNTLSTKQWQIPLPIPSQSAMVIARAAYALFKQRYQWSNPIRSVTVQAIRLLPQDTPRQIGMLIDMTRVEKQERLDRCVEYIRSRFGKDSIRNGILCQNMKLPAEHTPVTMPSGTVS